MNWFYLLIAVIAEIFGTISLKHSNGFQKILPTLGVIVGYALATYLLSIVCKNIPIGIVYALWSAVGIIGLLLIDHYVFLEKYNYFQLSGLMLIVTGSLILNFSLNPK
ncbi:MAG: SMR family transporter [Bacteriovorax sp.]|nr:SMR family transporter [Bacteriovorax sp.]